jgi:hypothetical protein
MAGSGSQFRRRAKPAAAGTGRLRIGLPAEQALSSFNDYCDRTQEEVIK